MNSYVNIDPSIENVFIPSVPKSERLMNEQRYMLNVNLYKNTVNFLHT